MTDPPFGSLVVREYKLNYIGKNGGIIMIF
jgi:hypothetical protein